MTSSERNMGAGVLGIIVIIGYIIFYFKGVSWADLKEFSCFHFLTGLGQIMSIYLILLIAFKTHSLLFGAIVAVGAVLAMDKLEDKLGITLDQENQIFAVAGVIGIVACVWTLVAGIREIILDAKIEEMREKQVMSGGD